MKNLIHWRKDSILNALHAELDQAKKDREEAKQFCQDYAEAECKQSNERIDDIWARVGAYLGDQGVLPDDFDFDEYKLCFNRSTGQLQLGKRDHDKESLEGMPSFLQKLIQGHAEGGEDGTRQIGFKPKVVH